MGRPLRLSVCIGFWFALRLSVLVLPLENVRNHGGAGLLAGLVQVGVDVGGGGEVRVAQEVGHVDQRHILVDEQAGKGVPLRYNYDKPEKPRRIKGFEVFSLVFSSFSKPKNHAEISRIIGGVSLTTNE